MCVSLEETIHNMALFLEYLLTSVEGGPESRLFTIPIWHCSGTLTSTSVESHARRSELDLCEWASNGSDLHLLYLLYLYEP